MGTPGARKAKLVILVTAILVLLPLMWHLLLNNVAVYRRISLAPGTVTQDFRLNYSGYYRMGIQAERKFPRRELQCLLGINDWLGPKDCTDTPLKYSWTLSCDGGKMTSSGSSEKIVGGAYAKDWMESQFGGFEGKRGQRCQLKMNIVDGSRLLSDATPKLHVYIELL
jgi:hypothetical protein